MAWTWRGTPGLVGGHGIAALLALRAGCGDGEAPETSGTQMGAPTPQTRTQANRPPQIDALRLKPRSPQSGGYVEAVASASDPDGDPTWVLFEWTLDGARASGKNNRLSLQSSPKGARVEVRAIPTDGKSQGESVSASVRVENAPPRVADAEYDLLPPVQRGQTIGVVATAHDTDLEDKEGLELRYRWYVNGVATGNRGRRFNTSALRTGARIHARVVAWDGEEQSAPHDMLPVVLGNLPPVITSHPETGLMADGSFRYSVEAEDPDGDRGLRFELVDGPDGMQIDEVLGEIAWTPGEGQLGEHRVEVHVVDSQGGKDGQVFPILVSDPNAPPADGQVPAAPAN